MATNIEQRVVQMRFDNAQFEKGIAQSYNSLDRFEKKLNFKGAAKGLESVQQTANQLSFDNLDKQIGVIEVSFNALSVVATQALTRITGAAMDTAAGLAKAFTLDPIFSGLSEYELKLNSIQTILANTKRHGTTIDDVSTALDDLNHYADKTIYNFAQMTQSIGMFTAAGVELEPAKEAIKGISNLAAFVGAPASDASRAMYQLSQGLATGYINLRDWMSLENTAGMSGMEFQDRLKDTARVFGMNVDAMIEKNGSFRESLKEGWLTSEVLIETLKQFAGEVDEAYLKQQGWTDAQIQSILELGRTATESATVVKSFTQLLDTLKESAQSGWAESWEIIIGNIDEAKTLWTGVNNVIGGILEEQARRRNEMLQGWKDLGGRSAAILTIKKIFDIATESIAQFTSAFRDIFPPMTAERLFNMTLAIKEFVYSLEPSQEALNTIRVAFKAVLIPVSMFVNVLKLAGQVVVGVTQIFFKMVDKMLAWPSKFATIEEALASVFGNERAHRMAEALSKITDGLGQAFNFAASAASELFSTFSGGELPSAVGLFEKLLDILGSIGGWVLDRVIDGLEVIASFDLAVIGDGLLSAAKSLAGFVSQIDFSSPKAFFLSMVEAVKELIAKLKELALSIDLENTFSGVTNVSKRFGGVLLGIAKAAQELISRLTPAKILVFGFGATLVAVFYNLAKAIGEFAKIGAGVTGVLEGTSGVLEAFAEKIRGNKLLQIAVAIGALAAALIVLGMVDPERLKGAVIALTSIMGALLIFTAGMAAINKFLVGSKDMVTNLMLLGKAMTGMSTSVLLLAAALYVLGEVDVTNIGQKLLDMGVLLLGMVVAAVAIGKYAKDLEKTSVYVVSFSASILLLSFALGQVAKLDLAGAAPNLLVLAAAMAILSLVSKGVEKVKFASMAGLTLFILDIIAFAGVLNIMARLDAANLVLGIFNMIPIFAAILALSGAIRLAGGQSAKMGTQLLALSVAIVILGFAIEKIGSLDAGTVVKGATVVALLLALFGGIIILGKISGNVGKVGASFMGMAAAILILGLAIDYIGNLDVATIIKGGVTVGVLLILFGIINQAGNAANGAKSSIIAMSVCLGLLTASLAILTLIDFNELMGAALALGLVMAAMGGMLHGAKGLKIGSALASILQLVAVVSMLGLMFKYLDGIDPKSTLASATGLGIVMMALSFSFNQIKVKTGSGAKLLKTVATMILVLGSVATIFVLLQRFGQGNAPIQNAGAIGIVLAALTLSFDKIKIRTGSGANLAKTIAAMISMLAGVATVFGLLQRFGNSENSIQNAVALSTILLAVSAAMRVMEGVKPPADIVATLAIMGGMLIEAGIAIGILNAMEVNEGLFEKAASLSLLLVAMSAAIAVLSKVGLELSMLGSVAGAAIGGVATALVMIGIIGAFILAVGAAFEHFDALEPALAKAEEIFPRIGLVIGSFLGNIIGGFVGGTVGGAIEQFGTSLSNFATNVEGFLALEVNPEVVDAIGRLATVAALITAVEFLDAINIFTQDSSLEEFGKELAAFAPYFASFAYNLDGIPVDEVNASASALEALTGVLANIPTEGGFMGMLMGNKSLKTFGEGLVSLAEGLAAYGSVLKLAEIDGATVTKTNQMMEALVSLANNIPQSGGLASFLGTQDIGKFGEQLTSFSESLITVFANFKSAGIDEDLVKMVANSGKMLVGLANDVPKTGGLISFLGGHDIGEFGNQLVEYAEGLRKFFAKLKYVTIDTTVAKAATEAGKVMVSLAEVVPKSGPLITFLGNRDIGKFGTQIGTYGEGLASFFTAVGESGIDENLIELSKKAGLAFTEIADAIGTNAGLSSLLERSDLGVFGDQIKRLGIALAGYYGEIADIVWGDVSQSIDELKRLAELAPLVEGVNAGAADQFGIFLRALANAGVENFTTEFANAEENISSSVYNTINGAIDTARATMIENPLSYGFIVDSIIAGIEAKKGDLTLKARELVQSIKTTIESQTITLNQIGTFIMNSIVQSFEGGTETIKGAVKRVLDAALARAKQVLGIEGTHSTEFYKIGLYCLNGFINGIQANADRLYSKLNTMGNQAVRTFSDAVGVNSPSVKFAEVGMYAVLGFVEGIKDNTKLGDNAMVKMGESLLNSIKTFFEIRSPSRVTRDEVGRYIVEGIAEGITSNTSAEEAAQKKAQNIVNAFRSEFDRLSAELETANLEFQLWSEMNPNAPVGAANKAQTEFLDKQLIIQAQRVAAAEAQYKATLQSVGEAANETRDAYNAYLEEKISMAELAGQLSELRNSNADAFILFSQNLNEMYDDLSAMGFTSDEIKQWAAEQSGWTDMSKMPTGNIEEIMNGYMQQARVGADGVEVVIVQGTQKAVTSAANTARTGGTQAGTNYSNAAGQAVNEQLPGVLEEAWNNVSSLAGEEKNGIGEMEGWINGVHAGQNGYFEALGGAVKGGLDKVNNMLDRHSPSRVYYAIGEDTIAGMVLGISDNMNQAVTANAQLGQSMISSIQQYEPLYRNAGSAMMAGLAGGIASGASAVVGAATSIARQAIAATNAILGIHSPSREYYKIGKMIDQGLSNGILDNYGIVEGSLVKITDNMSDLDYTIRPVVDTTSIDHAINRVDSLRDGWSSSWVSEEDKALERAYNQILRFDPAGNVIPWGIEGAYSKDLQGSYIKLDSESMKELKDMIYAEGFKGNGGYANEKLNDLLEDLQLRAYKGDLRKDRPEDWQDAPVYSFTQNNYSPKSLSTAEIARQTETGAAKFAAGVSSNRSESFYKKPNIIDHIVGGTSVPKKNIFL